jgi:hypothetical protein
MVSIPKIIGVLSCSFVLCLSLSNVTWAAERVGSDPDAERKVGQPNLLKCHEQIRQGIETMKGHVLRVEGDNYVVKRSDGKAVRVPIDEKLPRCLDTLALESVLKQR